MLNIIVSVVRDAFSLKAAVVLLPGGDNRDGPLEVVATAGRPLSGDELRSVTPEPGTLTAMRAHRGPVGSEVVVLSADDRPIGLLGLIGRPLAGHQLELLGTFANHIALTVERAQLRDQKVRIRVLEEIDRLRQAMMGAVSHDLRTPLATIKTSVSALLDPSVTVSADDRFELLTLVEAQADRLARLVSNLLDLTRFEAGALRPRLEPADPLDLIRDALQALGPAADAGRVHLDGAGRPPACRGRPHSHHSGHRQPRGERSALLAAG